MIPSELQAKSLSRADNAFYLKLVFLGGFLGLVKGPAAVFGLATLPLFLLAFDRLQHHVLTASHQRNEIAAQRFQWTLFQAMALPASAIGMSTVLHLYTNWEEPRTTYAVFPILAVIVFLVWRSRVQYHLWKALLPTILVFMGFWVFTYTATASPRCFPLVCYLNKVIRAEQAAVPNPE